MVNSRTKLRSGDTVELKDGRHVRINRDDKTWETSDGKKIPMSEKYQKEFFPSKERLPVVERKEQKRETFDFPGGPAVHAASETGIFKAGKKGYDWLTKAGDEYLKERQADEELSGEFSQSNPYQSAAGTLAGYAPDLLLTKGMSAAKAGPLLTGLHAGHEVLERPLEIAGEAALTYVGGKFIDKVAGGVGKISDRRALSRSTAKEASQVRESNKIGKLEAQESNIAARENHHILKSQAQEADRLANESYQVELSETRQQISEMRMDHMAQVAEREAQIAEMAQESAMAKAAKTEGWQRQQNEYKMAERAWKAEKEAIEKAHAEEMAIYEQRVKEVPGNQQHLYDKYEREVAKNVDSLTKALPKDAKIYGSTLDPEGFIETRITQTGLGATSGGKKAENIIRSIFNDEEEFAKNKLIDKYRNLEKMIVTSKPEVANILVEFKDHLAEQLPRVISDAVAGKQIKPLIASQLDSMINRALSQLPEESRSLMAPARIERLTRALKEGFSNYSENGFSKSLAEGSLLKDIEELIPFHKFLGVTPSEVSSFTSPVYGNKLVASYNHMMSLLDAEMDAFLPVLQKKGAEIQAEAAKKLSIPLQGTLGRAKTATNPSKPADPIFPQAPDRPLRVIGQSSAQPMQKPPRVPSPDYPPLPQKPIGTKVPPMQRTEFSPMPEPTLPPAQGGAEMMGDAFERPVLGKDPANNLTKLGALKYLFGGLGSGVEGGLAAGYGGLRGLTNPNIPGKLIFEQGGIQAVQQAAAKYPSYHDGILEDPMERRSLVKEIEDDSTMPLEAKALLQSKVNRGKPLDSPNI